MTKLHDQVLEFMQAVGQQTPATPTTPDDQVIRLRARLIMEEALEFLQATLSFEDNRPLDMLRALAYDIIDIAPAKLDLPQAVDALADLDYVVEGARVAFGVQGEPIADEVHRTNMLKLTGVTDERGKRLKPVGWQPPDIRGCLSAQGWSPVSTVPASQPQPTVSGLDQAF